MLAACAFDPPKSESHTIALVGNTPDAGIIGSVHYPNGNFRGWQMRQWAIDDYNTRLSLVGAKLIPPVKPNFGVSDYGIGYHLMTGQAYDIWAELCKGDLPQ